MKKEFFARPNAITEKRCKDYGVKKIYGAINLDEAEYEKEEFREKWGKKYPSILKSWDANWSELTTFFNYLNETSRC
ncbi:MAG: transposase [Clostridiales bacterium]|jgi:transposase-like protein|nr:transposase [Clostridiales bacterium]